MPSELDQIASEILAKVKEVFVFGSTNKRQKQPAIQKFNLLLEKLTIAFYGKAPEIVRLRDAYFKSNPMNYHSFKNTLESSLSVVPNYNRLKNSAERVIHIRPEAFGYVFLFDMLKTFVKPEKFNWTLGDIENLYATFSDYVDSFIEETKMSQTLNLFKPETIEQFAREQAFSKKYESGDTFETPADRRLFLLQTITDVRKTSYICGIGNCSLMADVAFLEAMSRNLNCPVTYIRFVNTENQKTDVINAVALGNWPEAGCIIISPWQETHKQYIWQGSIEATPEIKAVNPYNEVKILFSFKPNDPDHDELLSMLNRVEYPTWLEIQARKERLAQVKEYVEGFQKALEETGYLPKTTAEAISKPII